MKRITDLVWIEAECSSYTWTRNSSPTMGV